MQVKSIVECSKRSILQYFWPSLSYHLSLRFLFCLFEWLFYTGFTVLKSHELAHNVHVFFRWQNHFVPKIQMTISGRQIVETSLCLCCISVLSMSSLHISSSTCLWVSHFVTRLDRPLDMSAELKIIFLWLKQNVQCIICCGYSKEQSLGVGAPKNHLLLSTQNKWSSAWDF